jgi:hypothetical protein
VFVSGRSSATRRVRESRFERGGRKVCFEYYFRRPPNFRISKFCARGGCGGKQQRQSMHTPCMACALLAKAAVRAFLAASPSSSLQSFKWSPPAPPLKLKEDGHFDKPVKAGVPAHRCIYQTPMACMSSCSCVSSSKDRHDTLLTFWRHLNCIYSGGLMVEYAPATGEIRVRFAAGVLPEKAFLYGSICLNFRSR